MNNKEKEFLAALNAADALIKAGVSGNLKDVPLPFEQIASGATATHSAIRRALKKGVAAGLLIEATGRSEKGRAVPTYAANEYEFIFAIEFVRKFGFVPTERQLKILRVYALAPERDFKIKELSTAVGSGMSITARDANILKEWGLIFGGKITGRGAAFVAEFEGCLNVLKNEYD